LAAAERRTSIRDGCRSTLALATATLIAVTALAACGSSNHAAGDDPTAAATGTTGGSASSSLSACLKRHGVTLRASGPGAGHGPVGGAAFGATGATGAHARFGASGPSGARRPTGGGTTATRPVGTGNYKLAQALSAWGVAGRPGNQGGGANPPTGPSGAAAHQTTQGFPS
jgi:hypothetical protein